MRAPVAAEAERTPPSCLSEFGHTAIALEPGDLDIAIDFRLRCQTCPSEIFEISSFPLTAPDPSPYFEVEPGQTLHRPPHTLKCISCGTERALFDIRTQGYDGVLNGGGAYESGSDGKAFIPGHFRIVVGFIYNTELDELSEFASGAKVAVSDLFDLISIRGIAVGSAQSIELSYECA